MSIPEHIASILPRVLLAVGAPHHRERVGAGMKCDGDCVFEDSRHEGEVKRVRVIWPHTDTHSGYDWGVFHYCATARAEDERRGFIVREEEDV